jgi:hypothetical protein
VAVDLAKGGQGVGVQVLDTQLHAVGDRPPAAEIGTTRSSIVAWVSVCPIVLSTRAAFF